MTNKEAIKYLEQADLTVYKTPKTKTAEALEMAIKALEAQTCIEDYPTCTECEHYDSEKHYCPRFCQVIKDTLAEAQPKKGKWVFDKEHSCTIYMYKCSNCNCLGTLHYKYCPNCGAEMSGGGEDEVSD